MWVPLKEQLPQGDEWVLLFNEQMHNDDEFPGLSVTVSNPEFIRCGNAIKQNYTHWARIPYPLPIETPKR